MKLLLVHNLLKTLALSVLISGYFSSLAIARSPTLWQLNTAESKIAYGSIKKNSIGELNHFQSFSGQISATGKVSVQIDLSSLETYIGVRNERMIKYVFGDKTTATLSASVDTAMLAAMAVGGSSIVDIKGMLSFLGKDIPVETSMFVARLGKKRLLVTTNSMIMLKTTELGIDESVSKLMALAKLPSITRVVPISLRFVFDKRTGVSLRPVQKKLSSSGSLKLAQTAGKKVFMQCQACHLVSKKQNTIGPHLVGVLGRKAATVEGFSYSSAMKASGITWDVTALKAFLAEPMKVVPGNKMPFAGLKKQQDIDNLIAYLKSENL